MSAVTRPARPLRVLFISNLFPDTSAPNLGIFNARLLRVLAGFEDIDLRVLALRPKPLGLGGGVGVLKPLAEDECLLPQYLRVPYLPRIGDRFNPAWIAQTIFDSTHQLIREHRPDVVLVAWMYPDAAAVSRCALKWGIPVVSITHGTDIHQYLLNPTRRREIVRTANQSSAVVCRSRELFRLLKEAGADDSRLHVIYNGVDTAFFTPGDRSVERRQLGWKETDRVILYVGNLLPIKNPGLALEAFSRARSRLPGLRIVFAGEGSLRDSLMVRAGELGIGDAVTWLGRQTPQQVVRLMRAANLLVVSSQNEGVPNVILEAMSSGLPVVATRVGGIPEVLVSGEHGKLVTSGDPDEMSEAILDVLANAPNYGRLLIHSHGFSWIETARRYRDLLMDASMSAA